MRFFEIQVTPGHNLKFLVTRLCKISDCEQISQSEFSGHAKFAATCQCPPPFSKIFPSPRYFSFGQLETTSQRDLQAATAPPDVLRHFWCHRPKLRRAAALRTSRSGLPHITAPFFSTDFLVQMMAAQGYRSLPPYFTGGSPGSNDEGGRWACQGSTTFQNLVQTCPTHPPRPTPPQPDKNAKHVSQFERFHRVEFFRKSESEKAISQRPKPWKL